MTIGGLIGCDLFNKFQCLKYLNRIRSKAHHTDLLAAELKDGDKKSESKVTELR
jgi:hypothetical protein